MTPWTPKEYQIEGIKFSLENSHAGLFFDPGLGKTSVTLAVIKILKMKGLIRRAHVVAPLRVLQNVWPAEKAKWADFADLSMTLLHGNKKEMLLDTLRSDIVLTTPEGLQWLMEQGRWDRLGADMLVVDESSFFRNSGSLRFKTIRSQLTRYKRRLILTASPAPNGYENLWAQSYILDMGGALERFITRYRVKYFHDVGYNYADWVLNPGADVLINERLKPLVLRGDAVDHLQMPQLIHNIIPVNLPDKLVPLYKKLEADFILQLGQDEVMAPNSAVLGNKLRQLCNGFLYGTNQQTIRQHDEKLDALKDFIDSLGGQPVLVMYEYDADRDAIRSLFKNWIPSLDGNATDKQAADMIAMFNAGKLPVMLAHPASAGHGLNLQGQSQHVVFFGPTWNLEWHDQSIARVWRQGNPHDRVFVHTLAMVGTKDEEVAQVMAMKDRTQRDLLSALKRPKTQPIAIADAAAAA